LFNLARAELRDAVDGLRQGAPFTRAEHEPFRPEPTPEPEPEREPPKQEEPPRRRRRGVPADLDQEEVRRYYANLELPLGASADEVKAAYRRLMRRYHPDHHQADSERAKVATKLAQELRVAYESLMAHLERQA
jgi:DnaJ-domain-containing protein 1